MGLLTTGIVSMTAISADFVEVSADNLAQLERLAGFGRFTLAALLVAVLLIIVHLYVKMRVAADVRKIIKLEVKYEAKKAAARAVKDACHYGEIYDAINKEIDDACDFGAVYRLFKYGEQPQDIVVEDYKVDEE